MKTATITFQAAENYGAFLQAYALQKYLIDDLNVDNDILNFVSDHMKEHYRVFKKMNSFGAVAKNLLVIPISLKIAKRRKRFNRDHNKYLKLTNQFSCIEEYKAIIEKYDVAIAGSDQIWNLESEDYSDIFFLPYAKKKISYAASFGKKILDDRANEYRKLLSDFYKVSVREKVAADFVNTLGLKSGFCATCIDPTFLITKNEYLKLAGNQKIIMGKYILYYSINNSKESMWIASQVGKILNLPVYAVYSRMSSISAIRYGLKLVCEAGPSEFLNLLNNAEYILTNSFHGTALSIILQKKFYRLGHKENGLPVSDDRIDSILNLAGLSGRNFYLDDDVSKRVSETINWIDVEQRIQPEIDHSKAYLKDSILEG